MPVNLVDITRPGRLALRARLLLNSAQKNGQKKIQKMKKKSIMKTKRRSKEALS